MLKSQNVVLNFGILYSVIASNFIIIYKKTYFLINLFISTNEDVPREKL